MSARIIFLIINLDMYKNSLIFIEFLFFQNEYLLKQKKVNESKAKTKNENQHTFRGLEIQYFPFAFLHERDNQHCTENTAVVVTRVKMKAIRSDLGFKNPAAGLRNCRWTDARERPGPLLFWDKNNNN